MTRIRKIDPELKKLAGSIGEFIQYFGFKSVHGKIWTLLFLSKRPLAAVELGRMLGISKTLLSFSIRDLLKYQVIESAGKGPKRTLYYRANPNVTQVITNVLRMREQKMLERIGENCKGLQRKKRGASKAEALNLERLKDLGDLIHSAQLVLNILVSSNIPIHDLGGQLTRNCIERTLQP